MNQQVSIITGAASGIGYGIAKRLGSEGCKVIIFDFDSKGGYKASKDLIDQGIEAYFFDTDVANEKSVLTSMNLVKEKFTQVDILVNNVGITGSPNNLWETPVEEMDRVYFANLRSVFLMCNVVTPIMLEKNYGRIINIASIAGKEGNPKMAPYSSTKAAVIGLTKSLGKELAQTGIRVNCVTPAVVKTKLLEQVTKEVVDYMVEKIPMKRTVEISEVASIVSWLSSEECSASTGAVFDISGGRATY